MDRDLLERLFGERTAHCPIRVDEHDRDTRSRIGGRPPAPFATTPRPCPACTGPMEYFLTLGQEVPATPELSVFLCRDFRCLLRSRKLVDPPSAVAIGHAPAARSAVASPNDSSMEPRALVIGPERLDVTEQGDASQDSKIGGQPGWLQNGADNPVASRPDLELLFQFSELSYPRGMKVGQLRLGGGILYVLAPFTSTPSRPGYDRAACIWQST